jgi:sirohydrochlorin ferrochelatase
MSGTKLHCPPAPAINPAKSALVLGWYGSRNSCDHARMDWHLNNLVQSYGFASGHAVPLMIGATPLQVPHLEDVRDVLVLPLFMCEGWTLHEKLPAFLRLLRAKTSNETVVHELSTIGTHETLARLVSDRAIDQLHHNIREAQLILVAHGSDRDKGSLIATRALRDRIRAMDLFADVHDAYLEASPDLCDVVSDLSGDCVVEGLFMTEGRHSTHDLSARMEQSDSAHLLPCQGAIGMDMRFGNVISAAVGDAVLSQ